MENRKSLYDNTHVPYTWKEDRGPRQWICPHCYALTFQENADEHLQWHINLEEAMEQRLQEQLANAAVELLKMWGGIHD